MPGMPKSPPELVALFGEVTPDDPEVEPRKMFGYPCFMVRGQLAAGLHGEQLMMRLSETDRAAFLELPGTALFAPMHGRPMKEYVVAPESMLADRAELGAWLAKSVAHTRSLPPKPEKKAKGKK